MLTINRINRVLPLLSGDPWKVMAAMSDQFLRDLDPGPVQSGPVVRVAKSDTGLLFEIELPGRDLQDLEVALEGRVLEVKACGIDLQGQNVVRSERHQNPVNVQWKLPFDPQPEGTHVSYEEGILRVVVQQAPVVQRRTLEIRTS